MARRAHVLPAAVYLNSRDFEDGEPPERWVSAELDDALASVVALACALRDGRPLEPPPIGARFAG